MKKSILILTCLAMVLGLVGAFAEDKTPIEIYNPGFKFPTERINLTFWDIYGERPGWGEWADRIAKKYTKLHPNVRIARRNVPIPQVAPVFGAAVEANTLPDVFTLFNSQIHSWGVASVTPDWVTRLIDEKYSDAAKNLMTYNGSREEWKGKYIGWLSVELDPGQMLYYNVDMFDEAGVTVPKTAPEMVDAMKKTTKYDRGGNITQGGYGIRYFGSPGGISGKWSTFLKWWRPSKLGWALTEDWNDVPDWTGEDFVKGAQLFHDMVWDWKVASIDMPAPAEAFKLGLVSMTNREGFLLGVVKRDAPHLNIDIAPVVNGAPPFGDQEVGNTPSVQWSTVWHSTKYPEVSWDFNMYLNTDEHEMELSELTGSFPRRQANINSEYAKNLLWNHVMVEMSKRTFARNDLLDPWGVGSPMWNVLGQGIEKIITNKDADIVAILAESRAQGRNVLKQAMEAKK